MTITGETLIAWGFKPGAWFKDAIHQLNGCGPGWTDDELKRLATELSPPEPAQVIRTNDIDFAVFLNPEDPDEQANLDSVVTHMDALMRTPTLRAGVVLPDAMPSGAALGTIPVGGVVAAENAIHPGFHSADICCSMAISVFKRGMDVGEVLDIAMKTTHFGRTKPNTDVPEVFVRELDRLLVQFDDNPFLKGLQQVAFDAFMTQGDGNHFFYVGNLRSTNQLSIVTHHGSRGLGMQLYKRGMAAAKRHTAIVSPRTPDHNAWMQADSEIGVQYWTALSMIREWTRLNHFAIHRAMQERMGNQVVGQFWNEHNFVFQKSDGLFYHGKGATPNWKGFSPDDMGYTLIPMNMAEPILISEHVNNPASLGFAPHGAGRNYSRTTHLNRISAELTAAGLPPDVRGISPRDEAMIVRRETDGLDIRFFTGKPDLSELPSAYKNAAAVKEQIKGFGLANIVDEIVPRGSIMAGEGVFDWRTAKAAKRAAITAAGGI